jgi:hypothetical protein
MLHDRCQSADYRILSCELDVSIPFSDEPAEAVPTPQTQPSPPRVFVVLQASDRQSAHFIASRENQVFWRMKSRRDTSFAETRTAGAHGCGDWQLCLHYVERRSATIRVERRLSAVSVRRPASGQQSLWPDCFTESELLPMPT